MLKFWMGIMRWINNTSHAGRLVEALAFAFFINQ